MDGCRLVGILRSPTFRISIHGEHLKASYVVHEKALSNSPFFAAQMRWHSDTPGTNNSSLVLNLPEHTTIETFEFLLVGWYTFSFDLAHASVQQLLALLALCEVLLLYDLTGEAVQELEHRTISVFERTQVCNFAELMGETALAKQLQAFNYTDECENVRYLLFSRLPQMALENDWESTGPERNEVMAFVQRHSKFDSILDALEQCDFCKTFLRYEFEGLSSSSPKMSLLPNFFFIWEILETYGVFYDSSRPVLILLTHLQSVVERYRVFWDQNPFYMLYIELLRVAFDRLKENSSETQEFALLVLSRFVDFAPKMDPRYAVCKRGHAMRGPDVSYIETCPSCGERKAQFYCTENDHLCRWCALQPTTVKALEAQMVVELVEEKLRGMPELLKKCLQIFRDLPCLLGSDTANILMQMDPAYQKWQFYRDAFQRPDDAQRATAQPSSFSIFGGMFIRPGKS